MRKVWQYLWVCVLQARPTREHFVKMCYDCICVQYVNAQIVYVFLCLYVISWTQALVYLVRA
jgi:hypothetical protein